MTNSAQPNPFSPHDSAALADSTPTVDQSSQNPFANSNPPPIKKSLFQRIRKMPLKSVAGLLVLFLALVGVASGVALSSLNQDLRQQAYGPTNTPTCSSGRGLFQSPGIRNTQICLYNKATYYECKPGFVNNDRGGCKRIDRIVASPTPSPSAAVGTPACVTGKVVNGTPPNSEVCTFAGIPDARHCKSGYVVSTDGTACLAIATLTVPNCRGTQGLFSSAPPENTYECFAPDLQSLMYECLEGYVNSNNQCVVVANRISPIRTLPTPTPNTFAR